MNNEKPPPRWDGDVAERSTVGDFLRRFVVARYQVHSAGTSAGALCFALDGDWGAGKSFFLSHWSGDLESEQHPVVRFDAWANDLTDDPLVGFMSSFQSQLKPWLKRVPVAQRGDAARKLKAVVKQAGRAIVPAAAVVAKSVLKKAAGVELAELSEALSGAPGSGRAPIAGSTERVAGEALDKFFEHALRSHQAREKAVVDLRDSIQELLEKLVEAQQVRLPLFVFVDELDRCRPDYAIRLLEGVKHLFNANGVCFVFATNLQQLAASARGAYGSGFDAPRYFHRFFAFQYKLPRANDLAFAKMLMAQSLLVKHKVYWWTGLPFRSAFADSADGLAAIFASVSEALTLDLRSQRQALGYAEAVASQFGERDGLCAFYLFFLCALFQKNESIFHEVVRARTRDKHFIGLLESVPVRGDFSFERRIVEHGVPRVALDRMSWSDAFINLHIIGLKTPNELGQAKLDMETWPDSAAFEGSRAVATSKDQARPLLAFYADLIATAGYLRTI